MAATRDVQSTWLIPLVVAGIAGCNTSLLVDEPDDGVGATPDLGRLVDLAAPPDLAPTTIASLDLGDGEAVCVGAGYLDTPVVDETYLAWLTSPESAGGDVFTCPKTGGATLKLGSRGSSIDPVPAIALGSGEV